MNIRLSVLCTALILCGCAAVPDAPRDMANIALPHDWQQAPSAQPQQNAALPAQWWRAFNDPELSRLIDTALRQNNDLAVAAFNLQNALLQSDAATAELLPKLSASASGSSSKSLEGGASSRKFGMSGGVSFQVDLFGRLLKARDARQWQARATAEDRHNVALTVATKTASLYWQLAALNRQITLSEQNLANARQLRDMVKVKYEAGAVAQMEVLSTEQSVRNQEDAAAILVHQRTQARNALAVLLGEIPGTHFGELPDVPAAAPPGLPATLPAEVLDHRPDVRAARMRLMADMANVSIAVRDFFPVLNLSANAAGGGTHLSDIVANPTGSLALGVLLPFLNMPQNAINLKTSQNQYQANLAQYKKTLYTALSEVEDAFSQQTQLEQQAALLTQNLTAARQLETMRKVRYEVGADALQELLNAQDNTRAAELALLQNRLARYQNFLTRYVALGGGAEIPRENQ